MSGARSPGFLFDPSRVADTLTSLPCLRARLADPGVEGEPSRAFPAARRSSRQIFRILGNDHYEHLAALLRTLERCISAGFDQPQLTRSRSWKSFAEGLAEIHIAEHLLAKGFSVAGFDGRKGNESVPDILASRQDMKLVIEVYTPRRWEGFEKYQDSIRDELKYLDAPYDFRGTIEHTVIDQFRDGRLCAFHPGILSSQLETNATDAHVANAVDHVRAALNSGHATAFVRLDALNLLTRIQCEATRALDRLPNREVTTTFAFSGHAPERDFEDIADRSMRKIAKGQATRMPGAVGCLIVDLSLSNLEGELKHPVYQQLFAQTLNSRFLTLGEHGLVAFVRRVEWSKPPVVLWMQVASGVPDAVREVWRT